MKLEEIILRINQRVPEIGNMDKHNMELQVTQNGIKVIESKIALDIKKAFIEVLNDLNAAECYSLIQNLLSLNHYRDSTQGLWATDITEFIDQHREKLFKLQFTEMPGWIVKGKRLRDLGDDEDDDD